MSASQCHYKHRCGSYDEIKKTCSLVLPHDMFNIMIDAPILQMYKPHQVYLIYTATSKFDAHWDVSCFLPGKTTMSHQISPKFRGTLFLLQQLHYKAAICCHLHTSIATIDMLLNAQHLPRYTCVLQRHCYHWKEYIPTCLFIELQILLQSPKLQDKVWSDLLIIS